MAIDSTTLPRPADEPLLALPEETDDSTSATSGMQAKIAERPLISLGAGLIGGMVLGGLLGGSEDKHRERRSRSEYNRYPAPAGSTGDEENHNEHGSSSIAASMTEGLRKAAKQSGLEEHGRSTSTSVMSSLNDTLRSVLSQQLPDFDQKLKERKGEQGA
jgi:hypothetical protein